MDTYTKKYIDMIQQARAESPTVSSNEEKLIDIINKIYEDGLNDGVNYKN